MPTYTCPVSLATFQYYLNDSSTDATYKANLQRFLDASTDRIYNYLRRDYTPNASHIDQFFGNDTRFRQLRWPDAHEPIDAIVRVSMTGVLATLLASDFLVFTGDIGLLLSKNCSFYSGYLYRVTYHIDAATACPEQVQQAIMEYAYLMFDQSRRGLGAFGKATDFSNVLAQSQIRFQDPWRDIALKLQPFIYLGSL